MFYIIGIFSGILGCFNITLFAKSSIYKKEVDIFSREGLEGSFSFSLLTVENLVVYFKKEQRPIGVVMF